MSAQSTVLASVTFATATTTFAQMRKEGKTTPIPRVVIGGFGVAVILLVMADSQPELARAIALVLALAAATGPNGTELWKALGAVADGERSAVTRTSTERPSTTRIILS